MTREKKGISAETLYKIFIYVVLITLAVIIIVPVGWVFLASIKQNSEFYGNPWALPAGNGLLAELRRRLELRQYGQLYA